MLKNLKEFQKLSRNKKILIVLTKFTFLFLLLVSLLNILNSSESEVVKIVLIFFTTSLFLSLTYLSAYDLLYMEIPAKLTVILPILLLISNILFGLMYGFETIITFWGENQSSPLLNILGGLVGAIFLALVVFATKEKGMGEGDIWVIATIGLMVGLEKLPIAFYIAIFSALFVGLLYSAKIKRFKGVPIPFVPFLVFGGLLSFALNIDYRVLFFWSIS